MTKAAGKLFIAIGVVVAHAGAQSGGKIRVCVNPGDDTPTLILVRAEAIASRMFATAGVAVEWRSKRSAVCQGAPEWAGANIEFVTGMPAAEHAGALAYAQINGRSEVVVIFDRVEVAAGKLSQVSNVLAHVMTHEVTHILQGVARHSETGVMKAHWAPQDFNLMTFHSLAFAAEDIELIRRGFARREGGLDAGSCTR